MKTCFKCKVSKPESEFYKHSAMADGYLGKCKTCACADTRNHYRSNRVRIKKYYKQRDQRLERKLKATEYKRKARAMNPIKWRARYAVANAIRDGRLKRAPCKICGGKSEAHHHDYSKPFEVDWLCFKHHREAHGQEVIQ